MLQLEGKQGRLNIGATYFPTGMATDEALANAHSLTHQRQKLTTTWMNHVTVVVSYWIVSVQP